MSEETTETEKDVTEAWRATETQKSSAKRLRLFAAIAWIVAIGGEIAGIVLLLQGRFDDGNLPLMIGLLVGIAVFAIVGSLMWESGEQA